MKILVIHGPNLNLLGTREPELYGSVSLEQIDTMLLTKSRELGIQLETFQTNSEAGIVDRIQESRDMVNGIVINPAAFTHTSVSIRDALLATRIPFVEIHLSNIYCREPFRAHSFLSDVAVGVVSGFGSDSYVLGLTGLVSHLRGKTKGNG